ncbi:MAG: ABC transporter ATP-binding protein, partial [Gemmataceae bacterium]
EATSALSAERVRNLYGLLARTATTYLSVGSGQPLLDYHDRLLRLHGDGTWTVSDTIPPRKAEWDVVAAPLVASLQVG